MFSLYCFQHDALLFFYEILLLFYAPKPFGDRKRIGACNGALEFHSPARVGDLTFAERDLSDHGIYSDRTRVRHKNGLYDHSRARVDRCFRDRISEF